MDVKGMNLYFLYAYGIGGERHEMSALSGNTVPFFQDRWHSKHLVIYMWHSRGGKYVVSDFEYLYKMRDEFSGEVDFWFVNLSGADRKERNNAKKFAESNCLEADSILLDTYGEVAATFDISHYSVIAFVKRDNYVFDKLEGDFDEDAVRRVISSMVKSPLHRDF